MPDDAPLAGPAAIAALRRALEGARRLVAFTGAGISTESGIPDFRSPQGIWQSTRPILFDEFRRDPAARREAWRRRFAAEAVLRAAAPNRGHRALARLAREGRLAAVITQNIDGLHQESGIPRDQVIEIHGNTTYATCLACGMRHEIAPLEAAFARDGDVPGCVACGGIVKTATISFGQAMPAEPMARARAATEAADLFLVLGSSLVVQPAAGFPELAASRGATLVIVNREPTPLDDLATLVVRDGIGDMLGGAVGVN